MCTACDLTSTPLIQLPFDSTLAAITVAGVIGAEGSDNGSSGRPGLLFCWVPLARALRVAEDTVDGHRRASCVRSLYALLASSK